MKLVAIYLVLVGLPALGISFVLQAGQKLQPPLSFSGSWRIEASPDSVCTSTETDTLRMVVEQSGPVLQIRFSRGIQLVGRVEGDSFIAAGPTRVRLTGRRPSDQGPNHFTGLVSGAPCPAAKRTRIEATRIQFPADLAGH